MRIFLTGSALIWRFSMLRSREECEAARAKGFEPLFSDMEISLRVELQRETFGKGHTAKENGKFYRWCWEHKQHYCEECFRLLNGYSATYISHILSRGAHPAMAHDPRNVNILCPRCHSIWENGKRERMRIYEKNKQTIKKLKDEYRDFER